MSDSEIQVQDTQHAFLVAWGRFADSIGLIQALQAVALRQKQYTHTPQTKVTVGRLYLPPLSRPRHGQNKRNPYAAPGTADSILALTENNSTMKYVVLGKLYLVSSPS